MAATHPTITEEQSRWLYALDAGLGDELSSQARVWLLVGARSLGLIDAGLRLTEKGRAQLRTSECRVERTCLVTHNTMNASTGAMTVGCKVWETGPCRVPLFETDDRRVGVCRSCASGWTHPENYPTVAGREQIATARGAS